MPLSHSVDLNVWLRYRMNDAAENFRPISEHDIELLHASANAIQRLIHERNALRSRVDSLERELERLGHQTRLILDNYRQLTMEYTSKVQLIDSEVRNLFREPTAEGERPVEAPADEFPSPAA